MKRFLLSFLILFFPLYCTDVEENLKKIPSHDLKILEQFFKTLFSYGDFAYTLMGAKPMGCIDFDIQLAISGDNKKFLQNGSFLYHSWDIWKKYEYLFPLKSFIFTREIYDQSRLSFGFTISTKNSTSYKKNLNNLTLNELYQYYEEIGRSLGYGKNAEDFRKKFELISYLTSAPFNLSDLNETLNTYETRSFSTINYEKRPLQNLIDEYLKYNEFKIQKISNIYNPLFPLTIPYCISFPSSKDLDEMRKNYDHIRVNLIRIYNSEYFLSLILKQLTS